MKLEGTFLTSRVARRIFLLFFFVAVVPVATAGIASYLEVESSLRFQSEERLRETTKTTGMQLVERLDFVATEMKVLASRLDINAASGWVQNLKSAEERSNLAQSLRERLSSLCLIAERRSVPLFGDALQKPVLTSDQREHLARGKVLVLSSPDTEEPRLQALTQIDQAKPDAGHLLGEIDVTYLLNIDAGGMFSPTLEISLLDQNYVSIYSSLELEENRFKEQIATGIGEAGQGLLSWTDGREEYRSSVRALPLGYQFGISHLTLVLSESRQQTLAAVSGFRKYFPAMLLATLLLVALLSTWQIRTSLIPLEELRAGTQRIAAADFQTRVQVTSGDEFEELADSFNGMATRLGSLVEDLNDLNWSTLAALARTVDAKSKWTAGHSHRVTELALKIGREMGFDESDLELLHRGGLLHDIGKIGIPATILDKPGRLTDQEFETIKEHPVIGAGILEPIKAYADVVPIVLYHHERWNGSGYPAGLRGDEAPLMARVTAVADVFDAVFSDRPYRSRRGLQDVEDLISRGSGSQFDPEVVAALHRAVDRDPSFFDRSSYGSVAENHASSTILPSYPAMGNRAAEFGARLAG